MTAKIFHTVYEIWNPLTLECIYVGKGNTTRSRFPDHIRDARNFDAGKTVTNAFKAAVILKILKMGSEPVFFEIGRFETEDESLEEEKRLIEYYGRRIDGGTLTNFSLGGQGNYGIVMPEEHSRKKSERMKGRKIGEKTKEKIRKSLSGVKHTNERKANQSEAAKRKPPASEDARKKLSASLKGREISWGHKISSSKKGKWTEVMKKAHEKCVSDGKFTHKHSEETRKKIGLSGRGRIVSEETRERIRQSLLGRKHSEETKEKIRKTKSGDSI